jgi:hypothetical protein
MLTKQSTQLLNQLESLVYNAIPKILIYCKNNTPPPFSPARTADASIKSWLILNSI